MTSSTPSRALVAVHETAGDLAPAYSAAQINLIKETVAKGTSDLELQLFLAVCQRTGLDPFAKQLYAIVRGSGDKRQMSIQTGIDGYRVLAARTGTYAGSDEPVYDTEDAAHPNKASVTVYRLVHGVRVPFTASARWTEYKPQYGDSMWLKMPYLMLGKCAEALALRKAFPAEISGVYTADEMAQADNDTPYVDAAPSAPSQRATRPVAAQPRTWAAVRLAARDKGVESQEQWDALCHKASGMIEDEIMAAKDANAKRAVADAVDALQDFDLHTLPAGSLAS